MRVACCAIGGAMVFAMASAGASGSAVAGRAMAFVVDPSSVWAGALVMVLEGAAVSVLRLRMCVGVTVAVNPCTCGRAVAGLVLAVVAVVATG